MTEPENLVLQLLREMRAEMVTKKELAGVVRTEVGTSIRSEVADLKSEVRSLRADVASDLMTLEKCLSDQITGLRRAVMEYHSTTVGHGVLYSEIEERVRRIEQYLNLPAHGRRAQVRTPDSWFPRRSTGLNPLRTLVSQKKSRLSRVFVDRDLCRSCR